MKLMVAVRTLCEFSARSGDLDLRFTPAPSAQEGMAGHAAIAERRGDGYENEVSLSAEHGALTVRGRADGFDARLTQLEEIKTYRGDLAAMGANQRALHWAQARIYGHMMCQARGLPGLTLALVYVDIQTLAETVLTEWQEASALAAHFAQACERYVQWAQRQAQHRRARDAALQAMRFPHGTFRPGQRELAVAVFRAARDGRALLAQAPTGIGKTLGVLFPALKACAAQGLDKVFFLTAKRSGRGLALGALAQLPPGLRTVELLARDAACLHPDKHCHGESCPLARGFYDRLAAARDQLEAGGDYSQPALTRAAREHQLCPYFLNQEMLRWADVVIGDYNYYYDANGLLYMLTQACQWRVAVLVDEAHNLVERARAMYSAQLRQTALIAARRAAPKTLRAPLDGLKRSWKSLAGKAEAEYSVYGDVPPGPLAALQKLVQAVSDHQAQTAQALPADDALLAFYFDALRFTRLAEQFGDHSLVDLQRQGEDSELGLRNVVPASFLAARHAGAHCTVMFSGTMGPQRFYREMLGLPAATGWLDVAGPFRAEQLAVTVAGHVSTRLHDRPKSVEPIGAIIARQYAEHPGNYLAFLSSFDYASQVQAWLARHHPGLPVWTQTPGMGEHERDAFLAHFVAGGRGVGFAVLGGAFSEGVDLPGERLVGAFIATLGLPQRNPLNEAMKQVMARRFGAEHAYDYTYLYPGMRKVVQAAGRVIRDEADRGSVHLIDDRYRWARVRRLLPQWWDLP
ncbi:ATP-dependent DNA helicase [Bordetella genomosp. 12]|uniref:ATP-dependent DNA helicase n=1 Tax=Bordetella genomosp. 12 TaxID=463035 RepID=A0A261VKX1_9BORD|nr:ATP-dependent DNA helicase [Bordetella genomosp. 12]OZI74786.1 ATP-dependent DNA helicase [Bordetella genomosp. 12]